MEELDFIIEASIEQMDNSIKFLEKELLNIRAGKANPNMLSSVKVDYYGSLTPLNQIANVNTPDSQTLSIQPWEKDKLEDIEKAIWIKAEDLLALEEPIYSTIADVVESTIHRPK